MILILLTTTIEAPLSTRPYVNNNMAKKPNLKIAYRFPMHANEITLEGMSNYNNVNKN